MKTLRRWLLDWLFGFGEPVEDGYAPPVAAKPQPAAPLLIVTTTAAVVEVPQPASTEKCIVCQLALGKSPSDFFCTDTCQKTWMTRFGDPLPVPDPHGSLRLATIDTRRVG